MVAAVILAAWVAYGAQGAKVRVVVPAETACSDIHSTVDGATFRLDQRSAPDADFSIRVCHALVPNEARSLQIEDRILKAPKARPDRIVILGDTGCRIKGTSIQACNDPVSWPFATIAASAAREHPDLVIHVGDYHYRENKCPDGNAGCEGSPWGDNWQTWVADFVSPAAPLLEAAPWVMVRGNHEDCHRAGHGWTVLLDPDDVKTSCNPGHAPYAVDLGDQSLFVVDDNDADDFVSNSQAALRLRTDFSGLPKQPNVWMLTHHPWRGVYKSLMGIAEGSNATLLDAFGESIPGNVGLLLSGHIHVLQEANYQGDHPPQLITGTGGDTLDKGVPEDLSGLTRAGWTIQDGHTISSFGYAVLDRDGKGWIFTAHKPDGTVIQRCHIHYRQIGCLR